MKSNENDGSLRGPSSGGKLHAWNRPSESSSFSRIFYDPHRETSKFRVVKQKLGMNVYQKYLRRKLSSGATSNS